MIMVLSVTQNDVEYLVGLLETIADPSGTGEIFHEVRLSPEVTSKAREIWKKIKETE